jgi:hypothetical protein
MEVVKTNNDFFDFVFSSFKDHQWFQMFLIVEKK